MRMREQRQDTTTRMEKTIQFQSIGGQTLAFLSKRLDQLKVKLLSS